MKNNFTKTNYDKMAPWYNSITKWISQGGNSRSQEYFLNYISSESKVLTVGCGSIDFNFSLSLKGANITYLDISPRMLSITEKKIKHLNDSKKLRFICTDVMDFNDEDGYDVILANFFFNTFQWNEVRVILKHVIKQLKPNGILCIADEAEGTKVSTKFSQWLFRSGILWAHHLWANQPIHSIYNYTPIIREFDLFPIAAKRDRTDYILSTVYAKKSPEGMEEHIQAHINILTKNVSK